MATQLILTRLGQAGSGVIAPSIAPPRWVTTDLGDTHGGFTAFFAAPKAMAAILGSANPTTALSVAIAITERLGASLGQTDASGMIVGAVNRTARLSSATLGQLGSGMSVDVLRFGIQEFAASFGDVVSGGMTGTLIVAFGVVGTFGDAVNTESGMSGDLGWQWPVIRTALPDEQIGTVNLAMNPSLEYASQGIRGWVSMNAGLVIDRDTATPAWIGNASAMVTVTGGPFAFRVQTRQGMKTAETRAFIGSIRILGAGQDITTWLEAAYTNATSDTGAVATFTTDSANWIPVVTEAIVSDPLRVLDTVWLYVSTTGILNADAAQVEPDQGQHATPYADGDIGPYHRWIGPYGWSPSVRDPIGWDF